MGRRFDILFQGAAEEPKTTMVDNAQLSLAL
jgi:hypothetical protein